jgi:1-deoxy-D-xylulose-5-phosphate synthase
LGYAYLGPVDGHNIQRLEDIFEVAKLSSKACIIHVDTVKGKGYLPAQIDPTFFHGVGSFDISTGRAKASAMDFSKAFSEAICTFAQKDRRVCAVTAAMPSGTGLERFSLSFKDRYFDVGIAEQHAVTFSSGLAKNGMIPIFAVYSTFLQRAYDQLIHDISLQGVKVIFAVDRAGFVGSDGQTHQGLFDISMLNSVPYISIFAPASYDELNHMMFRAMYKEPGSCAIRYPRGSEYELPSDFEVVDEDYCVYQDTDEKERIIITFGRLFSFACKASDELKKDSQNVSVLKLNKIKPISRDALEYALKFKKIYFYEEGIEAGGVGEQFAIMLADRKFKGSFKLKAVDETFVKPADVESQLKEFGLDRESMVKDLGVKSGKEKA